MQDVILDVKIMLYLLVIINYELFLWVVVVSASSKKRGKSPTLRKVSCRFKIGVIFR